jgi:hypothetical protein
MKKLSMILAAFLCLVSVSASAAPAKSFYECGGIGGTDEWRVGINLKTKKAAFFDNDTTSYMKLKQTRVLESLPPQTQMTFVGKDESSEDGSLTLVFNLTKLKVSLYAIESNATKTLLGGAGCAPAKRWSDL